MNPTLAALVATAVASPLGVWHGRFQIKAPAPPANASADERARYAKGLATMNAARFDLTINADHTYAVQAVHFMMAGSSHSKGTWTQKGLTLVLTEVPKNKPQTFQLDSAGKTLTTAFNQAVRIVFTR